MNPLSKTRKTRLKLKLFFGSATIFVGLFGGTIVSPVPTALAVTCSGYACDNTNPTTTGCSTGAVSKRTETVYEDFGQYGPIAILELRYSPTCKTVWTRTTTLSDAWHCGKYFDLDPHYVERTDNQPPSVAEQVASYRTFLACGVQVYTNQLYLPSSNTDGIGAFACTNIWVYEKPGYPNYSGGAYECTSSWNGLS